MILGTRPNPSSRSLATDSESRRKLIRFALAALPLLLLVLLFSGCDALGGPQNTFSADGEVAEKQKNLLILTIIPAFVIFVLIMTACVFIVVRYRRRSDDEPLPKQVHGNTRLELAWTIIPALLLVGIAVPILITVFQLGRDADADALQVTVYGQQWDWSFEYPDYLDASGKPLRVTREAGSVVLHIPVGRQVNASLVARDVIHSFWVPKLAGKEDVIPGRDNELWFNADTPGVYDGQCAEFCGENHATMKFTVMAQDADDFQAWIDEQLAAQNARLRPSGGEQASNQE